MPKKGWNDTVVLVGGPKDGKAYKYSTPLPKVIVFQDVAKQQKHNYYRKPDSTTYVYAEDIPTQIRETLGWQ